MVEVGLKIKTLRTLRGLFQTDLEERTGIPRIMIIAIEKGDVTPGTDQLKSIEAAFELELNAPEVEAAFSLLAGEAIPEAA